MRFSDTYQVKNPPWHGTGCRKGEWQSFDWGLLGQARRVSKGAEGWALLPLPMNLLLNPFESCPLQRSLAPSVSKALEAELAAVSGSDGSSTGIVAAVRSLFLLPPQQPPLSPRDPRKGWTHPKDPWCPALLTPPALSII